MSNMHKMNINFNAKLAYVQYDMINVKISSKHDNLNNDIVNYPIK